MVKAKVIAGVVAAVVAAVLVVTLSVALTRNGDDATPITASPANQESGNTATTAARGGVAPGGETPDPVTPAPEPATKPPTAPATTPPLQAPAEAPTPNATSPTPSPAETPSPEVTPEPSIAPTPTPKATVPAPTPEATVLAPTPEATAPAPAPEATPAGGLFGYFHWAGAQCPDVGGPGYVTTVGTPAGNPSFAMKDEMKDYYAGAGSHVPIQNGKIKIDYKKVVNGDTYCKPAPGKKILVGGTILFKDGPNGGCSLPPTKTGGGSCCYMKIWQPNNEGFYENDCSVTVDIGGDGTWWLYTEFPGDETNGGYADSEAHLHYDLRCTGCNTGPFGTLMTDRGEGWWNKWWQEQLCTAPECGKTGPQHLSIDVSMQGGVKTFKYHTVVVYK